MREVLWFRGGLLALVLFAAPSVRAHGVETSFSGLEATGLLRLQTSFSTGEPLADAEVRLQSPDGRQTLALGRTDAEGRFQGRLPADAQRRWELARKGGDLVGAAKVQPRTLSCTRRCDPLACGART